MHHIVHHGDDDDDDDGDDDDGDDDGDGDGDGDDDGDHAPLFFQNTNRFMEPTSVTCSFSPKSHSTCTHLCLRKRVCMYMRI